MNKLQAASMLMSFVLLAAGCNQSPSLEKPAPNALAGVAVIDLDEVARQLGSDKQIVTAIKQREAALNNKLSQMAKQYTAQFEKQKETLNAVPQEQESAVQLATFQQQVNQNYNNARAKAQQDLSAHRSDLIERFRNAVRPTAQKVAAKRGLKVILTQQESLIYDVASECDITEEVVSMLRTSSAKKAKAEAQQREG